MYRAVKWISRELRHSSPKPKPVRPARGFQGLGGLCRKDNSSQSSGGRLLVVSRYHDGIQDIRNGSTSRFWNKDQIPFRPSCGFPEKNAARLIKVSPKP